MMRRALAIAGVWVALCAVQTASQAPAVPADLRPLLTPPQSEMRLVAHRYLLDRQTLSGNYAGSGRTTAGITAAPPIVPISPARLARLKRFDLNWQQALKGFDLSRLSAAARRDLGTLGVTIAANLRALDDDAATLAAISPYLPFAPAIVDLVERRIRIEDVQAQAAAKTLSGIAAGMPAWRRQVEASGIPRDLAGIAADAVSHLGHDLREWFDFYNGYDPVFTWWMGLPFEAAARALGTYGDVLRTGAIAREPAGPRPPQSLAPPPQLPHSDVPDLGELTRLPQDEMIEIVRRFRAMHEGVAGQPPARAPELYRRWLEALKTLDFASLSRNAQIDYLFIKRTSQLQLERAAVTLPVNPPRKTDDSGITGAARGQLGLRWDLADEVIPYTPEELVRLADREFAWVEAEMIKASRELGFGDDWKRAVEHVKDMHPPPGGQPAAVRDLMREAVDYLRRHDLLTVPQVAAESMHMVMLTPEQQLINPFFRGGPRISVSYPTNTMTYEQRVQSMRGNNTPFSHATAHHEMIPGHNLDDFYRARHEGYRAELVPRTPFFREGWALYWELLLYDRGFNDTPAERIGALFWRMHRCARIVFSLRFHLGEWSPQEAVDFLVNRVGHERENATAEVRRSFRGDYGPLYQAAYLLGGLQIRSLHRELVESGGMTAKAFHDEMLRQNSMPIALLRLALGTQPLTPDTPLDWHFYGDLRR